ncbi:WGR domain-containing protein [Mesorhizobium sp. CA8]|nr:MULTISPECIES: WGR domain-containing protein [unclassified Mesorhizobium]MBZ9761733.1 WGR domain-containing protein [Mesorhizobium sp. CA8]MBZ9820514.1 WGR domain-containing protein [Mesorhizobium sp. CA4]
MLAQPYRLYVERTDAARNMARFYALAIETTLFGTPCLTRRWGRIGCGGQSMVHHFDREEEAVSMFLELLRAKRARGYKTRPSAPDGRRRAMPGEAKLLVCHPGRSGGGKPGVQAKASLSGEARPRSRRPVR